MTFPVTLGFDLAGVVEAIGADVTTVAVGDAVYGASNMLRQGAYAEYAVLTADEVAPKPTSVDFVTAAAVPIAGRTAWTALFDSAGLQAAVRAGQGRESNRHVGRLSDDIDKVLWLFTMFALQVASHRSQETAACDMRHATNGKAEMFCAKPCHRSTTVRPCSQSRSAGPRPPETPARRCPCAAARTSRSSGA